jgi:hypothetical protein
MEMQDYQIFCYAICRAKMRARCGGNQSGSGLDHFFILQVTALIEGH